MEEKKFTTPILLITFSRPEMVQKVFDVIKKVKPTRLFVSADAPRDNVPGEKERCQESRDIIKQVNWACEVKTLFLEKNLGSGGGPAAGINWFFENVEEGIILEEDCLPNESFFYFCAELLEYYRNNEKIMHISGNNFQYGKKRGNASYYFSEYPHIWGWATWRRAWKLYDFNCVSPEYSKSDWGKQWVIAVQKNSGLAILPNVNLVTNIGSGENAVHTRDAHYMNLPTEVMQSPLIHPKKIKRNKRADFLTYRDIFGGTIKGYIYKNFLKRKH